MMGWQELTGIDVSVQKVQESAEAKLGGQKSMKLV